MNQSTCNGRRRNKVPYHSTHFFGSHVIPEDHVLSRLYANKPGVQVSMVARSKRTRIPTVRELIEQLSKKHERLLQEELEAERGAPQMSSDSSTATSSGPYATDVLYGNDVEKSGAECRLGQAHHGTGESERVREGRRERMDHREQRKTLYSRDSLNTITDSKGGLERDDLGRSTGSLLHPAQPKGNQFKPNGLRNSIISKGRNCQDELVAMGTIWNPNVQSKPMRTFSMCTNSNTSAASTPRRISSVGVPTGAYKHMLGPPNSQQTAKSIANSLEPKYSDPLTGAPVQFQQRLAELSTLEADTVRYEKARKLKKKAPKQDRDS